MTVTVRVMIPSSAELEGGVVAVSALDLEVTVELTVEPVLVPNEPEAELVTELVTELAVKPLAEPPPVETA